MANVEVRAAPEEAGRRVLTGEALELVAELQRAFGPTRESLLAARHDRQRRLAAGEGFGFLDATRAVRQGAWRVAPTPRDLQDRRVEITGPVDRKMMINALNSGARVFMADFEDALSPTWTNVVQGQANLVDAVEGTIEHTSPDGKRYRLHERTAVLVVRPRGWHLVEKHVLVDGAPVSASLFDAGLYALHNADALRAKGTGVYYYLPKLESHLEARLWDDVFLHLERRLGLARGTLRATVLVETLPAAFEMDEILHALRDHAAGLNAGRWDYLFSAIKKLRHDPGLALADRGQVTMTVPFMRAYCERLVATCHRRGAHAIGGMAAFVPNRRDPKVTEAALAKVRDDKEREAGQGFDGTWVAHPDLVPVATEVFDRHLGARPHQLDRAAAMPPEDPAPLLDFRVPGGRVTEAGLRNDVEVALTYTEAWLRGTGAVAIHDLMEDAATAEIARGQLWHWARHGAALADGRRVSPEVVRRVADEELARIAARQGQAFAKGRWKEARALLEATALGDEFPEFLTIPAYEHLE